MESSVGFGKVNYLSCPYLIIIKDDSVFNRLAPTSDPRTGSRYCSSQATLGLVSTWMDDTLGTPGVSHVVTHKFQVTNT